MAARWKYEKAAPTPGRLCKDCVATGITSQRPAPHPGPRCTTHHREAQRGRRIARKVAHVEKTYSLPPAEYEAILNAQGRRCALCRRATGATKRLAVDHDHGCCIGPTSCGKCVRGLVCSTCNDVLAHFRDSPEAFERGAAYLRAWPSGRGPSVPKIDVYDGHRDHA